MNNIENKVYTRPFVDYYSENKISPTTHDISDLKKHFNRRRSLYRQLGIPSSFLKNKRIIEFGPGNGTNSIYNCTLNPKQYVLVEADPNAFTDLQKRLPQYCENENILQIENSLIEDFEIEDKFDFVFCEAVIPWQKDPASFLKRVAQFVAEGGILVITCMDSVGFLSEVLRRLISSIMLEPGASLKENIQRLLPIFSPHLSTLNSMSRSHEDWI